ncbi:MAG: XRE family transcriptional regulator [Phenylobacterium sp.]|nr:MAG: XRE family transcriptional regulator [Phenylobacterium sp.]
MHASTPKSTPTSRGATHVDRYIGLKIRLRRRQLGLSQDALAQAVGVRFQQLQKYESGANRVSASRLFEIARALRAPAGFFFEGVDQADARLFCGQDSPIGALLGTPDGVDVALSFSHIRSPRVRRRLLAMMRALADETGD